MDSPMSSVISVSGPPSAVSDIVSIASPQTQDEVGPLENYLANQNGPGKSQTPMRGTIPECDGTPLFESGDGDLYLWVNNVCFETHKYLIKRFNRLKDLLCDQPPDNMTLNVHRNEHGVDDFRRTFKVLYASIFEGPFGFDSQTLVSALRIATAYDYPALRAYTIQHLEQVKLTAIQRIKIAREFGLAAWEAPAFMELCARDEVITMEEAGILGLETFVYVAGIREREQRRRGKELDTQAGKEGGELGTTADGDVCLVESAAADCVVGGDGFARNALHPDNEATFSSELSCNEREEVSGSVTRTDGLVQPSRTIMKPSFIGTHTGDAHNCFDWDSGWDLEVPDCQCRFLDIDGSTLTNKRCRIEPCVAAAFKNVQVEQLAHSNNIAALESSMNRLAASCIPAPKPSGGAKPSRLGSGHLSIRKEVGEMLGALRERAVA